MVTGCSVSASLVVTPRSASASRLRSRHAATGLCAGSAQYSGGRPGLAAAGSGAFSQPGNLHVAVLVCSVMMPSGGSRRFYSRAYTISFHYAILRGNEMNVMK